MRILNAEIATSMSSLVEYLFDLVKTFSSDPSVNVPLSAMLTPKAKALIRMKMKTEVANHLEVLMSVVVTVLVTIPEYSYL